MSALAGRAYSSAGQAASVHSMAVLQVYQAKLLHALDEAGPEHRAETDVPSADCETLESVKVRGREACAWLLLGTVCE
ncbi:hypothetical protein Q8A67_003647 [Cirrhinus molitorella]|uniref:Uncharacterized protein n=1 Tax=Cirrhinus molitorella TaxID=172907 RepID=A0AA88Q8E2_9TELE|nr:hypothetical protein Q8A67_003647 [Cirrhinus molitorella]